LIQTFKISRFPVVLVGRDFWSGLIEWIKTTLRDKYQTISPKDIDLFHLVDTAEEATEVITQYYSNHVVKPNF
ncbi:MAG: LOG family protein, partial [Bacteroidota bacterium]